MFFAFVLACATTPSTPERASVPAPAPEISASPAQLSAADLAMAAADRSEKDRAMDAQRKPSETLNFFEIQTGQSVLEIGSGGGYTTELLARTVGPGGQVYGHNSPWVLKRFAEGPWSTRLQKPVMANVTRIDAEFDDALPAELDGQLDAAVNVLFYHDTVWMEIDRDAMNREIFEALKPGGIYGIVDHSAAEADGVRVTKSLHRISEQALIAEVTAAGFELDASADFLRNPEDTLDWSASPGAAGEKRGTSDRFVLKFRKPLD